MYDIKGLVKAASLKRYIRAITGTEKVAKTVLYGNPFMGIGEYDDDKDIKIVTDKNGDPYLSLFMTGIFANPGNGHNASREIVRNIADQYSGDISEFVSNSIGKSKKLSDYAKRIIRSRDNYRKTTGKTPKIRIIGHSRGGGGAAELISALRELDKNFTVDEFIGLDPYELPWEKRESIKNSDKRNVIKNSIMVRLGKYDPKDPGTGDEGYPRPYRQLESAIIGTGKRMKKLPSTRTVEIQVPEAIHTSTEMLLDPALSIIHSSGKTKRGLIKRRDVRKLEEQLGIKILDDSKSPEYDTPDFRFTPSKIPLKYAGVKLAQELTERGFKLSPGQTITHAMHKYNREHPDNQVTLDDIRAANNGLEDSKYVAGKEYLFRKPETEYTVVSGDILGRIARKHNTTVDEIVKLNNLESADKISVGQKLRIPGAPNATNTKGTASKSTGNTDNTGSKSVDARGNFNILSELLNSIYHNPLLESAFLSNIARETDGTFSSEQWEHKWETDPVTGKRFDAREGVKFDPAKKQYGGYGLYQLTGKNQTRYKNWLTQNNLEDSATNQVQFVNDVFGPESYPAKWKRIIDPNKKLSAQEYSELIHKYLLRPGYVVKGDKSRISSEEAKMDDFRKSLVHTPNGWKLLESTNSVPGSAATNDVISAQK